MKMNNEWEEFRWFLDKQRYEMNSPYSTGFNTWEIKKELWKLKYHLDDLMENAPTYAGETEWLEDLKTQKAFEKLSK